MKLNDHTIIIDEEKFIKENVSRVKYAKNERIRNAYLGHLEDYADVKGMKLCNSCFTPLSDDITKCPNCLAVNNP